MSPPSPSPPPPSACARASASTPAEPTPAARAPPSPSPSAIPHLYAELFLHIRTVTFSAVLQQQPHRRREIPAAAASVDGKDDAATPPRAELSADGARVTLTHAGESAGLALPVGVVGGGGVTVFEGGGAGAGAGGGGEQQVVSLRLRVKEGGLGGSGGRGSGPGGTGGENVVPWDARGLGEEGCGRMACRGCGEVVVMVGDGVKKWMDLPNENWAEMMDFWHCHKPHEHHLPGHTHDRPRGDDVGKEKGYAASNRIVAKKGVGYVDLTYLLLAEEDCPGVQLSSPSTASPPSSDLAASASTDRRQLICSSCKSVVGVTDPRAEGWRIWKWSIAVAPSNKNEGEATTETTTNGSARTYGMRKWIAAQLLYLIENQAVRKFTVTVDAEDGGGTSEGTRGPIMIWVFTPDLFFSYSIASSPSSPAGAGRRINGPTRGMKVLWKPAAPANAAAQNGASTTNGQTLDRQSLSTEELSLPLLAFDALREGLKTSWEWLPPSARTFQEWNVGLLERFTGEEVK